MTQRPHVLMADVLDEECSLKWYVECPYDGLGQRPCLLLEETPHCEWWRWDAGDHHPDCDEISCETRDLPDGTFTQDCWEGRLPDECDGVEHDELGHSHPTDGCAVQQYFDNLGWEGVAWDPSSLPFELTLPQLVTVHWEDTYLVTLRPAAADQEAVLA